MARKTSFYIPKQFEFMGHMIFTVVSDKINDEQGSVACAIFPRNCIYIRKPSSLYCLELIESSYYHEKSHFKMYLMGENDLNANEKFIDTDGNLEYQFIKTSGFRLPPRERVEF